MPEGLKLPDTGSYRLSGASVPSALLPPHVRGASDSTQVDIDVAGGKIAALAPAGQSRTDLPVLALDRRQVWPCFVDAHTHLDKGQTWDRSPNPDGTFQGALGAIARDRVNWSREDLRRRMELGLAASYAHGTRALRTHLDSADRVAQVSWPLFAELRREWAGRIELQAASLASVEYYRDPDAARALADLVARHGGVLGAVAFMARDLDELLDRVVRLAAERGLDLDFHTDENGDPGSRALERICAAVVRAGFRGKTLCGHCCSLAVQSVEHANAAMDAVAQAGVSIVSLPLCNVYLQDRSGAEPRTPRWRGITLLHELRSRGIPVALASDNVRDAFHPYGDYDLLEVFSAGVKLGHLDRPFGDWPASVTSAPASMLGLEEDGVIAAGGRADLVIFSAPDLVTLLARSQSDRVVVRDGRRVTVA